MRDLLDNENNTLSLVTTRNVDFAANTAQPQQQPVVAVGHYVWLVRHNWWKIALVVIDARPILKEDKKPPTYIGVAHTVFGIPTDMQVYPWVALKEEKDLRSPRGLSSE